MLGDPSVHVADVYVPPGHNGEGLRDAGIKAARGALLATTVSVTEDEKREILMNDFMLIPSRRNSREERPACHQHGHRNGPSEEPRRTSIGSRQEQ
jgi:hypothetical protein